MLNRSKLGREPRGERALLDYRTLESEMHNGDPARQDANDTHEQLSTPVTPPIEPPSHHAVTSTEAGRLEGGVDDMETSDATMRVAAADSSPLVTTATDAPLGPAVRLEPDMRRWTDRRARGLAALVAGVIVLSIALWSLAHQAPSPASTGSAPTPATVVVAPPVFAPVAGPALDILHVLGSKAGLAAPREAIMLPDQQIALVDTGNGRLVILARDGHVVHTTRAGHLVQPFALVSDGTYIYVLDATQATIERYNLKGQFVGELVHRQTLLSDGRGLALASGTLYVANPRSNSITEFELPSGILRHVFTDPGNENGAAGYLQPSDVAVDPEGDVYSTEVDNNIKMRQSTGRFIQRWPIPGFVTIFPVHVLPLSPGRLLASDPSGALLSYVGTNTPTRYPLHLNGKALTNVQPQGLFRLPDGAILVSDALGNRLLVVAPPP